jgi:hypothetical protein
MAGEAKPHHELDEARTSVTRNAASAKDVSVTVHSASTSCFRASASSSDRKSRAVEDSDMVSGT